MPYSKESMELALHVIAYAFVLASHSRRTIPHYTATFRKPSPAPLAVHIIAGLFEIFRYHTRALNGPVIPDRLDYLTCLLQSVTNLILAKTLLRGDYTTRPTYQVAGIIRPILGAVALSTGSAELHRASVKLVNGFMYTRLVIFVEKALYIDRLSSNSVLYARGVFIGAILSVCDAGLPAGVPIYIIWIGLVTSMNHLTSRMATR